MEAFCLNNNKNMVPQNTGTVKFFRDDKGFGSITDNQTGAGYIIKTPVLKSQVQAGDTVSFDLVGKEVYNVSKLN